MPKFLLDNSLGDCRSALLLPCQHCLALWGRAAGRERQIQGIKHPWYPALSAACPGANCGSAPGWVLFPSKVLWQHSPGLCSLSALLLWPPMAQGCKNYIRFRDVQWSAVTLWLKGSLSTCLFSFALLLLSACHPEGLPALDVVQDTGPIPSSALIRNPLCTHFLNKEQGLESELLDEVSPFCCWTFYLFIYFL